MKEKTDIEHIEITVDVGHTTLFKYTCQITSFRVYPSFVDVYVLCTFRLILSEAEFADKHSVIPIHYGCTSEDTRNKACIRVVIKLSFQREH